jgi:pentose-5-phosphate-3-epimerase
LGSILVIMAIIPSLLEYSEFKLVSHLEFIQNLEQKPKELHIDIVYKYYAQSKNSLVSLGFKQVLDCIKSVIGFEQCQFSVHLMANELDYIELYNDLLLLSQYPKTVFSVILVDPKFFDNFLPTLCITNPKILALNIGVWYDLGLWNWQTLTTKRQIPKLLMSVSASKSNQKCSPQVYLELQNIIKNMDNTELNLITFDGGLSDQLLVDTKKDPRIVSYGWYWGRQKTNNNSTITY